MNLYSFLLRFLLAFTLTVTASAWGNLGHRTVAYLAEKYISRTGRIYLHNVLGNVDLGEAAIWADWYKSTPEGKHTASWHFINANDKPPESCDLDFGRDCGDGCIVSAILNITKALSTPSTSPLAKLEGMRFLLHLIGDLHNPLQTENLARGGNDIPVLFDEKETNLHFTWDVLIPQKLTSSNETTEIAAAKAWAEKLHIVTENHIFSEDFWLSGDRLFEDELNGEKPKMDLVRRIESSIRIVAFARETNKWVCEYVLKGGLESIEGQELGGEYYVNAVPIVEGLIARAGRRLGRVINALAEEHGPW